MIFRRLLTLIFFAAVVFQAITADAQTPEDNWPISYPYQLNIQEGSYAWIVTPELCEKTTTLLFDWDDKSKILTVNGAHVYPGVPQESPYKNEQDMERIYGDYSIIREFYRELGSWVEAYEKYYNYTLKYRFRLNSKCRMFLSGEFTEVALKQYFRSSLAEYPYSEIFSIEKGLELMEDGFVIYANRPQPGFTPFHHLYKSVTQKKPQQPESGNIEGADSIVRRIVAHYKIQPYLPHVVFVCNGGPCQLSFGVDTVVKIESAISRAVAEKTMPSGACPLPTAILKQIISSSEGGK